MEENSKKVIKYKSLSFKLNLLFIISLNKFESDDKHYSAQGLQFGLEDIKSIQNLNNLFYLIFLYINKDKINELLYNKEELITIDFEVRDKKISQYIYLCFLIEEDKEICNYQYSFELINKLNEFQRGENGAILKKIIMAKIMLSLVDNYKQIGDNEDNKDNKYDHDLDMIYNYNSNILVKEKDYINQYKLKLEDFREKKIEEIYVIIIKYLIKNSKLEDCDYIESIINQIELESIILTKLMFKELIEILKKEKEFIKKYEIENFDDIFDKKKINFYYNLIRYILKQSFYINQIPFLLETKTKILNLIKKNKRKLFTSIKNCENEYKIKYILKQFIGDNLFKYYYDVFESIIKHSLSHNSSQQNNNSKPNQISKDNSLGHKDNEIISSTNESSTNNPLSRLSFKLEQGKSKRNFYSNIVDDDEKIKEEYYNENELEYKILNNSKFTLHTNKKGQKPFIIYDEIEIIINEKESEYKKIEDIRNATTSNKKLENNYKKFLSFLDEFESKLLNDFKNSYKLKMTLNFRTKSINNDDFVITCLYDVSIPGRNVEQFKDDNILSKGMGEGFLYAFSEINSDNHSKIEYS